MPGTLAQYVDGDNNLSAALLYNDILVIRMDKTGSVKELLGNDWNEVLDENNLKLNAKSIIHNDGSEDVANSTRGWLGNTPGNKEEGKKEPKRNKLFLLNPVKKSEGNKKQKQEDNPKSRPQLPPNNGLGNNYYSRRNTWARLPDYNSNNGNAANANKPNQLSDNNNS